MVDGGPVDWGPYTDTHIYTLDWIGTGSAVGFKLYDINDNNTGGLTVKIYLLPVEVGIDIKPGSDPNSINLDSNGVIPVAILGSADFDASTVDPSTVLLGGSAARVKGKSGNAGSLEDVNNDGYLDLVVQVYTNQFEPGVGMAELTGETYSGIPIFGTDSISIVSK